MLQIARLAPRLLDDAADQVVEFLTGELNADGGARDRAGQSDLYYTAFALEALVALQAELPRGRTAAYLTAFGDGTELDLVHRACLVRCWASLGDGWPRAGFPARIAATVEAHRCADGGYGVEPEDEHGTLYNAFLVSGLYQDLGLALPASEQLAAFIEGLRTADGGFADGRGLPTGSTTPTTAAAATLLRQLDAPVPDDVGAWLLSRAHPAGGFLAVPQAPIPDLLSTATALHALSSLSVSFAPVRERCLDFLDSLWTGKAFCGHWEDDEVDCEYAFYALLALGHLSL